MTRSVEVRVRRLLAERDGALRAVRCRAEIVKATTALKQAVAACDDIAVESAIRAALRAAEKALERAKRLLP